MSAVRIFSPSTYVSFPTSWQQCLPPKVRILKSDAVCCQPPVFDDQYRFHLLLQNYSRRHCYSLSPKLFKVNEIYRMKVKFLFTNVCGVLKQSKPQIFRLAGKHIVGSGRNWMGLDSFIPSRCLVFITQRGSWSTYRFLFIHLFEQRGIYQDHWSLLSGWLMLHFLDIAKEKEPFW